MVRQGITGPYSGRDSDVVRALYACEVCGKTVSLAIEYAQPGKEPPCSKDRTHGLVKLVG